MNENENELIENENENSDVVEDAFMAALLAGRSYDKDAVPEFLDLPLTLPLKWHEEDKDDLLESTFNHSSETIRKDTKMDYLLAAVGGFAIICLAIMLFQCFKYHHFTTTNIICFVCYIVIALLFMPKPMQCLISHSGWKLNAGRFAAFKAPDSDVTLTNEKAKFNVKKKSVNVAYKYMEAIYETEKYYILMVESKRILTFCKDDLNEEQNATIKKYLEPYMK